MFKIVNWGNYNSLLFLKCGFGNFIVVLLLLFFCFGRFEELVKK